MNLSSGAVGAVLAGGRSRRMGADKARLELEGRSFGARAAAALGSELERVVVVSGRLGDHPDLGVPEIADRLPGNGPLGGLHAALDHAGGLPVFALACDLPAVGPELVAHLLELALPVMDPAGPPRAVVPALGGRLQPLCGVYSPACKRQIELRLAAGARRVLDLIEAIDAVRVELGPELAFYRDDLLENVNDPELARRLGVEPALSSPRAGE